MITYGGFVIYSAEALNISIEGNNMLISDDQWCHGIHSDYGSLTLSGSGSLGISGSKVSIGLRATAGINILSGTYTINSYWTGISSSGNVNISQEDTGNTTVNITVESLNNNTGIYSSDGDVNISGGTVTINTKSTADALGSYVKPLFKYFNFEIKYYKADGSKTLENEGFKGYSGVVVIDKYNGEASLPKSKQIYYSYDLSKMSKFDLDKLPYIMIYGVRIYGTDKFIKPSKKGGDCYDWGYYDQDLQELAYVADSNFRPTIEVDIKGYALTYNHMGDSDLWTLKLTANSTTDEYRLKISSGYLGAGLSNDFGQSHLMSYTGTDKLARNVRNFLKAFLYKISSTPELIYDAILDSWLADSDRVSDKKFEVVGDAKIKFDNDTYEYVIKSAKD